MSLLSYLFKNSTIRLVVYGVGIASAFIVTPHILRSMGSNIYGIWVLIASLTPYFAVLNFANSGSISTTYAKAYHQKNDKAIQQIFVAALQFGAISTLCTFAITLVYYFLADKDYLQYISTGIFALSLFIFAGSMGIYAIINTSHGLLAGQMRWSTLALTSMIRVVYSSVLVLLFLNPSYTPEKNLLSMTYINSTSFLLEASLNFFLARKYMPKICIQNFYSNPFRSDLYKVSQGLSITMLGSILRNSTQVYLVGALLPTSAITLYALAKQITTYMNDLLASAFGIMSPYFSKLNAQNNIEESHATLLTSIFLSCGMSSIIALGLVFYGDLFFIRWIGKEYATIHSLLIPIALAGLLELGPLPLGGYLVGIQQQNIVAKVTIIEGIFTTCASIPALILFGLPGIGWTIFVSSLIFRTFWLPFATCRIANLAIHKYYTIFILALAPTCLIQYIYYVIIKDFVIAEYTSILLAGLGQGLVACITLFITAKLFVTKSK